MDIWKAEQGRGREKRKIRREKIRRERVRGQKIQMREKVGKSRNTVFFQWFVAPEGRKVGSLKRRVRSQLARWEMKSCTPLWREAHFEVKSVKNWRSRTTFASWDVEKVHAVVARSTFPSQNVQSTRFSDHFWKLRCRKSVRRCGAKHILKSKCTKTPQCRTTFGSCDVEKVHAVVARSTFSKSKCTKHTMLGPLLEVQMSKKCTPLWSEVHFVVKMLKTPGFRTTFGGSDVASLHYTTLHSATLHYTTLHYITLHYTTLPSTTLHYITLHYTTLHYTTNTTTQRHNYTTTFHYATFHYTPLQNTTFHYTPLHYTPQH